ncbi:MAG: aspartate-semialdehyde dehydrogenase [Cyanobacteria bacterium HKST-UBA05]|nr:aspartate-semialdehyde dehydrogenase [Cyanobacteria bacterium HKST-UBA05]
MSQSATQPVVAVLGATGLVGQKLIALLEKRRFPLSRLKPLASQRTAGQQIPFAGQSVEVEEACPEAFEGVDLVLASAGGAISQALVHQAVARGAVVVDNTSCFRMHPDVPLVVAGVNNEALDAHNGVIANPNCSTAQLMPVLKALMPLGGGLQRVVVSTYQSVSGAGKEAIDELRQKSKLAVDCAPGEYPTGYACFARPMAFNLIPHIDVFMEEAPYQGYTKEEWKLIVETRKILDLPQLPITATAVRVPVMVGHSESVTVDFNQPVSLDAVTAALRAADDVVLSDGLTDYPTPLETEGTDPVYVGRLRRDASNPEAGVSMWVVADNLMIGAALNAVRLAEALVARGLVTPRSQCAHLFEPAAATA